jgi:hypothetical protein
VGVGLRVWGVGGIGLAVVGRVAVGSGVEVDAVSAVLSVVGIVLGIVSDVVQAANKKAMIIDPRIRIYKLTCFIKISPGSYFSNTG